MAKKKRKPRLNGSLKGTVERMAKAKGVTLPPAPWDTGASGPAARARPAVIEDAIDADPETGEVRNPNGVKRLRIVDMLEVWHKRGVISTAGFNAAEKLRDAFEATQRAPGWPDNDRVQSSPKPDHAVTIQIDRVSRYHAIARFIWAPDWPVIDYFVLQNREADRKAEFAGARYKAGLAELGPALDRLADRIDPSRRGAGRLVAAIRNKS